MRTILGLFLSLFIFMPTLGFAFDLSELKSCQGGAAIKTLVLSDTLSEKNKSQASEIRNIKNLEHIFGKEKQNFTGKYVFLGNSKPIHDSAKATWYNFKSKHKKPRTLYRLYYGKNEVMKTAEAGDLLVVCKKDKNNVLLLVAKKGSKSEKQVHEMLGLIVGPEKETKKSEESKSSFWSDISSLWESGSKEIESNQEYEIASSSVKMEEIPTNGWIRVYFTPGYDCENNIIEQIKKAKKIDIVVYSITNKRIGNAILAAHKRGAKIRILTDRLQSAGKAALADEFAAAGIPVYNNKGSGHKIEHNKWVIFDGKDIEYGSYNWTEAATKSNSESCMFFREPTTKDFTNRFKYLLELYGG